MQRSDGERLASLETDMKTVKADVAETKGDVKLLLGAHHAQAGVLSAAARVAPWIAIVLSIAVAVRSS